MLLLTALLASCTGHGLHWRARMAVDATHGIAVLYDQGKYEQAMQEAEKNLERVSDFSGYNEQSVFEAYVTRGFCWTITGMSKLMLAVPHTEDGGYRFKDLFQLEGTAEGGAAELRKGLAEFDQAERMPRRFVAMQDPYHWIGLAHEHLGEFRLAEEAYRKGVVHAQETSLSPVLVSLLHLRRGNCLKVHAYHIAVVGPEDKAKSRELLKSARADLAAAVAIGSPTHEPWIGELSKGLEKAEAYFK